MPWVKKWGNVLLARLISRVLWGEHFTDVSCGFRAYSREAALRLNLFGRFTYTQETFIDLASKGVMMTEVPLRVRGVRESGESRVAKSLWVYAARAGPSSCRRCGTFGRCRFFGAIGLAVFLFGVCSGSRLRLLVLHRPDQPHPVGPSGQRNLHDCSASCWSSRPCWRT